jgi:hypothetical protein
MFNWIKNLFTAKTAEPVVLDSTTHWPFPTAEKPVAANSATYEEQAKPVAKPKTQTKKPATTKPKATATKKAAPKTASKKPAAIKAEPAKRGRKPKTGA